MRRLELERFAYSPHGTFGQLYVLEDGEPVFRCYTVECPWRENRRNVSCIPEGCFPVILDTHRGEPAYELEHVPGRTEIDIHVANTIEDLEGCIGPGLELGSLGQRWAVLDSQRAFDAFMQAMDGIERTTIWIRLTPERP